MLDQPVAKVRAEESRAAGHHDAWVHARALAL
jgi:hypothetical protein